MFKTFLAKAGNKFRAAKAQVRKYRLFAKDKTKAAKDKMVAQMASIVAGINQQLGKVLAAGAAHGRKLRGQAVVARRKLGEWHETMSKLVPQIRRSVAMMGVCGQRAVLGLNLTKLVRGAAQNRGIALAT